MQRGSCCLLQEGLASAGLFLSATASLSFTCECCCRSTSRGARKRCRCFCVKTFNTPCCKSCEPSTTHSLMKTHANVLYKLMMTLHANKQWRWQSLVVVHKHRIDIGEVLFVKLCVLMLLILPSASLLSFMELDFSPSESTSSGWR